MPEQSKRLPPYPLAHQIRFWMSTPAITVSADGFVSEALALMHEHSIRRLPVVDGNGELCGIITDGDIRGSSILRTTGFDLSSIAASLRHIPVCEVMTSKPMVVMTQSSLREAALLMLDNKIGGLPVVDDTQSLVGMVTESDLFEALVLYLDRSVS